MSLRFGSLLYPTIGLSLKIFVSSSVFWIMFQLFLTRAVLTGYYLKRGYPFKSLKKHYHRASKFNQDELLDTAPRSESELPVMVTQFNPTNPPIGALVRNNWNIIQNTEELTKIFKDKPIVGYRRLPNRTY